MSNNLKRQCCDFLYAFLKDSEGAVRTSWFFAGIIYNLLSFVICFVFTLFSVLFWFLEKFHLVQVPSASNLPYRVRHQ